MSQDDKKDSFWKSLYEIGYGKPPVKSRWVKGGKSPNPLGRKKKKPKPVADSSTRDRFLSATDRPVTIREGNKVQSISTLDAIIRAEALAALKGNTHAQKNILDREARYRKYLNDEISEGHEFWQNYAATYEQNVAAILKANLSVPAGLAHPDDLVFEEGRHVTLRGGDPLEAAQHREFRVRLREVFMLQAEKDRRSFRSKTGSADKAPIFVSELLVERLNSSLPTRLQLNELQRIMQMDSNRIMKMRDIQKLLRREWAELGMPEAQDLVNPPVVPLLVELGIATRHPPIST